MPGSTTDELLLLHRRLLQGDRTVPEEIARRLLKPLCEEVQRSYPQTDEQVVQDGVIEVVLDYCERPERTEVTSGLQLRRFLAARAWRKVANALRGERRRRSYEARAAAEGAVGAVEQESPLGRLIREEVEAEREQQVQRLMETLSSETDREMLRLRLVGERRTEVFARVLGVEHLPTQEQRRIVKRAKDRIDKVIQRSGGSRR
ncbi:MAG TPA: hypothetical protein VHG28_19165 [Longimicrobiaceae bacterium]|nr:hypothetical protein [Longimicrobiaceae bacterium]